jgi:hypothetical protein
LTVSRISVIGVSIRISIDISFISRTVTGALAAVVFALSRFAVSHII